MNNQERLESHKRMYSWVKEQAKKNRWLSEDDRNDWYILEGYYPDLLTLVEDLISDMNKVIQETLIHE